MTDTSPAAELRAAPIGISRCAATRLWFWHCRVCPGFPTVGYAHSHPAAVERALHHFGTSAHVRAASGEVDGWEAER
ncbi:hypothetical protein [Streptomyces sp. NPDC051994]|uniref:hypothetical protein n=1 Tax=unclassified Streptomyces TaxID=2593676 RepID=UPI00341787C1